MRDTLKKSIVGRKIKNVKLLYQSEYYYKNRLASLAKGDMIEQCDFSEVQKVWLIAYILNCK